MSFQYPLLVAVAVVVGLGLAAAYRWLHLQRTRALATAGLTVTNPGWSGRLRRHLPVALFLVALTLLMLALARPQATVAVPRISGTVILAFDVSNSMSADDIKPTRLAAAQEAAINFVEAQPDTVDIGVVAFDQGALVTHRPTAEHQSAIAAIKRLNVAGGTSLGQAILASLTTITGKPVSLPDPNNPGATAPNIGYWGSATIVLLTDGEDTGGPDALAAADLAATAGVHIETIGVGTVQGATIEVDGYQVATSLNEELLTEISATTNGKYHRAEDAEALAGVYKSLDLRITTTPKPYELTGAAIAIAVLLLTIGGFLMISWYGRIV